MVTISDGSWTVCPASTIDRVSNHQTIIILLPSFNHANIKLEYIVTTPRQLRFLNYMNPGISSRSPARLDLGTSKTSNGSYTHSASLLLASGGLDLFDHSPS